MLNADFELMEKGKGFEELEVWRLARTLVNRIYGLTRCFPEDERFGLTAQARRASVSVMSNIAEGWGRHSETSLAHFLDISKGSLNELLSLMYVCSDQNILSDDDFKSLCKEIDTLGAKLYRFIQKLRPNIVREELANYGSE